MRKSNGFTLTEMLIVMGIILVVAIIAIPSIKALTGGRSIEAAQNQISSVMSRARTEAVGLQEPRGILLFRDPDTQRVGLMLVKCDPAMDSAGAVQWYNIDLDPDRDVLLLPPGVGVQAIASTPVLDRYLGFNKIDSSDPRNVAYGGVILFDGTGRLIVESYRLMTADRTGRVTELARLLFGDPSHAESLTSANQPNVYPPRSPLHPSFTSSIGLVVFDESEFNSNVSHTVAQTTDTDTDIAGASTAAPNGPYAPEESAEETWLDQNATPLLVNRYNGTLVTSR